MRDNGLSATSYTSMGEIAPEVAGPVLEALATAGIAAYAESPEPPPGDEQPTVERLYVDAAAADRAGPVIRRGTEEAEWRSLVEQFNAPSTSDDDQESPAAARWPAAEDVDSGSSVAVSSAVIEDDGSSGSDEKPKDDPRDHYIPPEPTRGPRLDWISRLAWTGVLGGPVLLVLAAIFELGSSSRVTLAALLGFAGGFLTLVFRMKDRPNIDDTPDDGAVV